MAYESFETLVDFLSSEGSESLSALPPIPDGLRDGIDGGFVDDGMTRYWVSGEGHYEDVMGSEGRVSRRWVLAEHLLKFGY